MRVVQTIVVGFSLLCLMSCSDTRREQSDDRPVNNVAAVALSQSDDPSAKGAQQLTLEGQEEHGEFGQRHGGLDRAEEVQSSHQETHQQPSHAHSRQKQGGHDHKGNSPHPQGLAIGEKVPDFTVTFLNGKTSKLSDLQKDSKLSKSGVIVLTFWCSFCHSCRHIEHDLDQLAKAYEGRVAVIALDASAGETAEDVVEFAKKKGLTLPIVLDPAGESADIFRVQVTTTSVIIDSRGVLRYRGQFGHGEDSFAADALKAVLTGQEVSVKETPLQG